MAPRARFDPYAVLGVPPTASRRQIKRAYRREALRWHPDKNHAPEAYERFLAVQRAWELLRSRRADVDTFRPADAPRRRSAADWFRVHRRAGGGPPPKVYGEGERAYVLRKDYRTFTWLGLRFRNTESIHNRIALSLSLPATAVIYLALDLPFHIGVALLIGVPVHVVALVFVLATSRYGSVRHPWNRPLDFEPGERAVLTGPDGGPVPLFERKDLRPASFACRVRPGTVATVLDVHWHPDPAREAYRVRTAGGRTGWVARANLESQ